MNGLLRGGRSYQEPGLLLLRPSTTVAYRPCTALTHYILWLSSELSAKCAVLIHYATVVLGGLAPAIHPAVDAQMAGTAPGHDGGATDQAAEFFVQVRPILNAVLPLPVSADVVLGPFLDRPVRRSDTIPARP